MKDEAKIEKMLYLMLDLLTCSKEEACSEGCTKEEA